MSNFQNIFLESLSATHTMGIEMDDSNFHGDMGGLPLVGSLKLYVSFEKGSLEK